jgi:hypothetical protein
MANRLIHKLPPTIPVRARPQPAPPRESSESRAPRGGGHRVRKFVAEHPVALVAVALASGLVAGWWMKRR